ncbi:hypothetical protein [Avibacterium paragallinarum]
MKNKPDVRFALARRYGSQKFYLHSGNLHGGMGYLHLKVRWDLGSIL